VEEKGKGEGRDFLDNSMEKDQIESERARGPRAPNTSIGEVHDKKKKNDPLTPGGFCTIGTRLQTEGRWDMQKKKKKKSEHDLLPPPPFEVSHKGLKTWWAEKGHGEGGQRRGKGV
jgi:hypothetical protein